MFKQYKKQLFIALLAYIGQITYGFMGGWTSPVVPKLEEDPDLLGGPNDVQISMLAANIYIGALVGAIPMSIVSNHIGRKWVMVIGAALTPTSYLCMALVQDMYVAMVFRTVIGLTAAIAMITNLVYLGEIASTEIRGIILGTTGVFNSVGFLTIYLVGHYLSYEGLNYVGMAIGIVYFLGMLYVPESPAYLVKKGRDEEAKAILIALNRVEDSKNFQELRETETEVHSAKWTDLFTVKCNRKALIITASLFILQQLSGVSPLLMYTTTIFQLSGSSIPAFLATIIIGVVQLISGLITPLFIEKYGRKFLLLVSTMASCLALAMLSVYLNLDYFGNPVAQHIQWLPLTVAIIHFVAFSFGFGPIPSALVGEMFEISMRSAGTAIVIVTSWAVGYIITLTFGSVISTIGIHVAFIFFSVMCGVTFLFTLFVVPETKGKTLLEIQKMLS